MYKAISIRLSYPTLLLWVAVLNTNTVKIKYAWPKILTGHLVGSRGPKMARGPQLENHWCRYYPTRTHITSYTNLFQQKRRQHRSKMKKPTRERAQESVVSKLRRRCGFTLYESRSTCFGMLTLTQTFISNTLNYTSGKYIIGKYKTRNHSSVVNWTPHTTSTFWR